MQSCPKKTNGLDVDKYSWGQSLQEVNVVLPVHPGTKSRFLVCEFKKNHLKVGLKDHLPVIDGELFQFVKVNESFQTLARGSELCLYPPPKQSQMDWWKYLLKGEPEIDTQKIEPETGRLSNLDTETCSTVER